jgi:predicted N-acyltransferase
MKAVTFVPFNLGFSEFQFTLLTILNLRQQTQNAQRAHWQTHGGFLRAFTGTSLASRKSPCLYESFPTHITRTVINPQYLNSPPSE